MPLVPDMKFQLEFWVQNQAVLDWYHGLGGQIEGGGKETDCGVVLSRI